jgi:hypothetical protein
MGTPRVEAGQGGVKLTPPVAVDRGEEVLFGACRFLEPGTVTATLTKGGVVLRELATVEKPAGTTPGQTYAEAAWLPPCDAVPGADYEIVMRDAQGTAEPLAFAVKPTSVDSATGKPGSNQIVAFGGRETGYRYEVFFCNYLPGTYRLRLYGGRPGDVTRCEDLEYSQFREYDLVIDDGEEWTSIPLQLPLAADLVQGRPFCYVLRHEDEEVKGQVIFTIVR